MASSSKRPSWASASFKEMWTSSQDVFNRSGHNTQEDDERDLTWAAIERLPTYDRMRKGVLRQVLDNGKVVHHQVDVNHLGLQDKKLLIESILKAVEEDNEKFLRSVRDRVDRCFSITNSYYYYCCWKKAGETEFFFIIDFLMNR